MNLRDRFPFLDPLNFVMVLLVVLLLLTLTFELWVPHPFSH